MTEEGSCACKRTRSGEEKVPGTLPMRTKKKQPAQNCERMLSCALPRIERQASVTSPTCRHQFQTDPEGDGYETSEGPNLTGLLRISTSVGLKAGCETWSRNVLPANDTRKAGANDILPAERRCKRTEQTTSETDRDRLKSEAGTTVNCAVATTTK